MQVAEYRLKLQLWLFTLNFCEWQWYDPLLLAYFDLWPLSGHIFQYKMQVMTWADTRILKEVSNEYEHMSTKFHISITFYYWNRQKVSPLFFNFSFMILFRSMKKRLSFLFSSERKMEQAERKQFVLSFVYVMKVSDRSFSQNRLIGTRLSTVVVISISYSLSCTLVIQAIQRRKIIFKYIKIWKKKKKSNWREKNSTAKLDFNPVYKFSWKMFFA